MTASIERIDYDILEQICAGITAEVPSVCRRTEVKRSGAELRFMPQNEANFQKDIT